MKLLQMKSSDIEYYLNKNKYPKGDNTEPDSSSSPVQLSCAGRPIRKSTSASYAGVADSEDDNNYESYFVKSPNKKPNYSKPCASGPSASRVAAQNKRTGTPVTVLPSTSGVYNR